MVAPLDGSRLTVYSGNMVKEVTTMTVQEIFEDFKALKSYFETAFYTGELEYLEVRLRKFNDEYSLLWGDPCYDTDHRGQWSYGCITVDQDDETLAIMAADMLRELREGE